MNKKIKTKNLLTDEQSGQSGSRVAIDLFDCAAGQLADQQPFCELIKELADVFRLKLGDPVLFHDEAGAWSVAATGDNAYFFGHAFPGERHLFLDLFSALPFSHELALESAILKFQAKHHQLSCVRRELLPDNSPELAGYCRSLS